MPLSEGGGTPGHHFWTTFPCPGEHRLRWFLTPVRTGSESEPPSIGRSQRKGTDTVTGGAEQDGVHCLSCRIEVDRAPLQCRSVLDEGSHRVSGRKGGVEPPIQVDSTVSPVRI